MYLAEWMSWQQNTGRLTSEASDEEGDDLYEGEYTEELSESHKCVSGNPRLLGPVYVCDESVLELRCGFFEPWRGLATYGDLVLWIRESLRCFRHSACARTRRADACRDDLCEHPTAGDYAFTVVSSGIGLVALYFYFKYAFRFSRLEMLTSRHLLIRFNRVTQQVHLHRPRYCGGIVTLPWATVLGEVGSGRSRKSDPVGMPILLVWPPASTGLPHQEMAFVGRQSQGGSDLRDQWEYIRRFMEEGAENLPKAERSSQFPWPWQPFMAQFEGVSQFLKNTESPLIILGVLLISPAFLCIGVAHWISLLLCWKPRWPKVIREAGQPGKPVPKLTTIDDYPPDVRERLLANADQWKLKPGSRPEKKLRASRRKVRTPTAASNDDVTTPPAE